MFPFFSASVVGRATGEIYDSSDWDKILANEHFYEDTNVLRRALWRARLSQCLSQRLGQTKNAFRK